MTLITSENINSTAKINHCTYLCEIFAAVTMQVLFQYQTGTAYQYKPSIYLNMEINKKTNLKTSLFEAIYHYILPFSRSNNLILHDKINLYVYGICFKIIYFYNCVPPVSINTELWVIYN